MESWHFALIIPKKENIGQSLHAQYDMDTEGLKYEDLFDKQ